MPIEEVLDFLQENPPFQNLDAGVLEGMQEGIGIETYPQGTVILDLDRPARDFLRVIKKGAVKIVAYFDQDNEVLTDYRGEREIFGFLSLLTGNRLRTKVTALEETTCFLIDRQTFFHLLRTQPSFAEYLFASILRRYLDQPLREQGKRKLLSGGSDRLLFTTPIGELISKKLISASENISIREASEIMSRNRISSLVLLDPLGLPTGIITANDLRDKVVSKGRDSGLPVKRVQSVSLVRVEAADHCIEALFKMIHYNIHHLLVVDNGRLKGVVTTHDLMKLQTASPISLVREIEGRHTLEDLSPLAEKIRDQVGIFLIDGVKPSQIYRIATEVYDRLLWKMLETAERKLGTPPVPYCYVAFDRAARKEQALEQVYSYALIYSDPASPALEAQALDYFRRFTEMMNAAWPVQGFQVPNWKSFAPYPAVSRPLMAWKAEFMAWIQRADARAVAEAQPFLDIRLLYGDLHLYEDWHGTVSSLLEESRGFLNSLALFILKNSPPIGVFRHIILEKSGRFKGCFDLDSKGLKPLVDLVRYYALEAGIRKSSTLERLQALKSLSAQVREAGAELEYAFEFLSGLWLKIRQEQITGGQAPHPFLSLDGLNGLEKKTLKEVFALVARLQGILLEKVQPLKI